MNHLIAIVVVALFAQGVFTSMGEGMILEPVKNFLARFITGKWAHPFYDCPMCMSGIWGIPVIFLLGLVPIDVHCAIDHMFTNPIAFWKLSTIGPILYLPIYALCAVGLQELLQR